MQHRHSQGWSLPVTDSVWRPPGLSRLSMSAGSLPLPADEVAVRLATICRCLWMFVESFDVCRVCLCLPMSSVCTLSVCASRGSLCLSASDFVCLCRCLSMLVDVVSPNVNRALPMWYTQLSVMGQQPSESRIPRHHRTVPRIPSEVRSGCRSTDTPAEELKGRGLPIYHVPTLDANCELLAVVSSDDHRLVYLTDLPAASQ